MQRLAEEAVAHIQSAGCTTQKKSVIGASVLTTVYGLRFVYFAVTWASANPPTRVSFEPGASAARVSLVCRTEGV